MSTAVTEPTIIVNDEGIPVVLPSGATYLVLTDDEREYLEGRVERYLTDQRPVNISDLQDFDRMLILELLSYRYGLWASRHKDYFNETVDVAALRKWIIDCSSELRQIKKILGIDKTSRDRQRGTDSLPVYLENLRRRAKEFGVHRDKQAAKAIELAMELIGLIQVHDNADDEEKRILHVTTADVLEWIRTRFVPEFMALDEYFRDKVQRMWIRDM